MPARKRPAPPQGGRGVSSCPFQAEAWCIRVTVGVSVGVPRATGTGSSVIHGPQRTTVLSRRGQARRKISTSRTCLRGALEATAVTRLRAVLLGPLRPEHVALVRQAGHERVDRVHGHRVGLGCVREARPADDQAGGQDAGCDGPRCPHATKEYADCGFDTTGFPQFRCVCAVAARVRRTLLVPEPRVWRGVVPHPSGV